MVSAAPDQTAQLNRTTERMPRRLVLVLVLISLLVVLIGVFAYVGVSRSMQVREFEKLRAVANLKAEQVEDWVERSRNLAFERANRKLFTDAVGKWLLKGDAAARKVVAEHIDSLRASRDNPLVGVAMVDEAGKPLMTAGESMGDCGNLAELLKKLRVDPAYSLIDLHRHADSDRLRLAFATPVRNQGDDGNEPLAYLIFIIDPAQYFYPLVLSWPDSTHNGETLLFRREGEEAVLISPSRLTAHRPLELRLPLSSGGMSDVQAMVSGHGQHIGKDYRGVEVLASSRAIAGTPWLLLAKVDGGQAFADIRHVALVIVALVLMAMVTVVSLVFGIWRQQKLRLSLASGRQLATIAATLPGALFACRQDTAGRFGLAYASEPFAAITGLVPESLSADVAAFLEHVHPEELAGFNRWRDGLTERPQVIRGEWRFDHPERGEIWLEGHAQATLEDDGGLLWLGFLQDITQRKTLEADMAESEQHFRNLADNGDVLIWTSETNKLCNYFNKPWLEFTGRQLEQELGNGWAEGVHPEDFERCLQTYVEHFERREPFRMDYRMRHASGQYRWITNMGTPRYDSHGNFLGYIGHCFDITERIQAEEQIRKLSLAIEQSPESIVITDLNARIEYVNEAFVRRTGYSRAEAIGQNPKILQSGRTPQGSYEQLWEKLNTGEIWQGEFVNRRKDGSVYLEIATITPIRQPDGRITHYLAVKEDITEKKQLEAELEQHRYHLEELIKTRTEQLSQALHRAESANRAKSAFLANMSHEIRTPMNAILGLTHLLLRADASSEQREKLTKIASSAEHLLAIISDILDLSKIEADRMALEQTDFSLGGLLANVHSLVADQARGKGLQISIEIDPRIPEYLLGDPTRLRQALLNYASNAVKFTERGAIVLRARLENDADLAAETFRIRFEVEDTGIGMTPEVLERVFSPFEQADTSTTRRFGGTGLGLTITRRLAELMGGEAGASSDAGRGSVFWFTAVLRRGQVRVDMPQAYANAEQELGRRQVQGRLLLVEDNEINRIVALEMLTGANLRADTAGNGAEAVDRAAAQRYDLILMDVQMPVMGGIEATRQIRMLPGYAKVPIIAMTANAFEESRENCLAAGMSDFMVKPVVPEIFFATLLKWLPQAPTQPATPTMADHGDDAQWQALKAIPGLDFARGRRVFAGKLPKYLRLLRMFVDGHAEDAQRIHQHLAAGETEAAWRMAHALKGGAGNLGLERIFELANLVYAGLKQTDGEHQVWPDVGRLDEALTRLATALEEIAAGQQVDSAVLADMAEQDLIPRLSSLLDTGDMAVNDLVREQAAPLRAILGDGVDALQASIAAYDYGRGQAILREILEARKPA